MRYVDPSGCNSVSATLIRDKGKVTYDIIAKEVPNTEASYSELWTGEKVIPQSTGPAIEIVTAKSVLDSPEESGITGGFALSKDEAQELVSLLTETYNL